MSNQSLVLSRNNERLSIRQCRELLGIQSRDTINDRLKILNLFGCDFISWQDVRRLLELQLYLGLKPGCNSKEEFCMLTQAQIDDLFESHAINVEERFSKMQTTYHKQQRTGGNNDF